MVSCQAAKCTKSHAANINDVKKYHLVTSKNLNFIKSVDYIIVYPLETRPEVHFIKGNNETSKASLQLHQYVLFVTFFDI